MMSTLAPPCWEYHATSCRKKSEFRNRPPLHTPQRHGHKKTPCPISACQHARAIGWQVQWRVKVSVYRGPRKWGCWSSWLCPSAKLGAAQIDHLGSGQIFQCRAGGFKQRTLIIALAALHFALGKFKQIALNIGPVETAFQACAVQITGLMFSTCTRIHII